jgi:hypothetical protein
VCSSLQCSSLNSTLLPCTCPSPDYANYPLCCKHPLTSQSNSCIPFQWWLKEFAQVCRSLFFFAPILFNCLHFMPTVKCAHGLPSSSVVPLLDATSAQQCAVQRSANHFNDHNSYESFGRIGCVCADYIQSAICVEHNPYNIVGPHNHTFLLS